MNAALCHVIFISVHPFGTYVSGMCRKSDAVGAAAAGMVRFRIWRGRGQRGERKMNAALRRVIFIAAHPSGSYVSGGVPDIRCCGGCSGWNDRVWELGG